MYKIAQRDKGFTLVELSIVLIIIGLLIASVTTGTSLIKAAYLQAVITENNNFTSAVNSFFIRYNFLPGDMPNATSVIQNAQGNGDGNGELWWYSPASNNRESLLAWNELSLTGVLPGHYQGEMPVGNNACNVGQNCPASKYSGAMWSFSHTSQGWANYTIKNIPATSASGDILCIGGPLANNASWGPILTVLDSFGIDTKLDDGDASYGSVFSVGGCTDAVSCSTQAVCLNGVNYDMLINGPACVTCFVYRHS